MMHTTWVLLRHQAHATRRAIQEFRGLKSYQLITKITRLLLGMPLQLKAAASAAAAPTAANQTTAALASSSTAPQLYTTSCYPTHNLRHDWKGPPATTGFDNIGLLRTPAILSAYMTWSNIKFGHSHTAVGVAQ
jgi:hypothetical protein